jgi:sugar/nucleoside kinase (ribokinase family)
MKRRINLSDIAATANVSVGTVSNVLNSPERVRPATRDRVYSAMRELGYRQPGLVFPAEVSVLPIQDGPRDTDMPLLVSVGYISVDMIARIGVMPHRNDRITAEHISKRLGGPAANVAVAAAALGPPFALEVELATVIGKDADSLWALEQLARRGVRAHAVRSPFRERLSRCIVLVEENGQRTKINEPLDLDREDLISHLPPNQVRRRSHLHFEGYHANAMMPAVASLRARGWTISTQDTGLPPEHSSPNGFRALIHTLDAVFINRRTAYRILGQQLSAEKLTSAMAEYLADAGNPPCTVALTLGMDGAAVFPPIRPGNVARATAPAITVVDGTGAGDGFVGAFLAQWLHGEAAALGAARACVAASLIMTVEGAQGRATSAAEIDVLIKDPVQ